MNKKTGTYAHSYFCIDSISLDEYRLNVLLENSNEYTPTQIIKAIDSTLSSIGISHERRRIENEEAVVINYGRAMEADILTNEISYYFVVVAKDSLPMKFERSIATIKIK